VIKSAAPGPAPTNETCDDIENSPANENSGFCSYDL
jgi:hypothetical protein